MANGTLSNYFDTDRAKAAKKAGGASPYSAPADAGGSAPSGGGPSAPSAPKGSAGGGTGFVSFGQYFGANAPAIQQQAQKQAVGAKDMGALNTLQQPGGMEGSAFDRLLGGGVTQREAAKQGQYRFQQLGARLNEGVDTTMGGKEITRAKEAAYADWTANLPTQYRYNNTPEQLRAMFEDEWKAGTYKEKTPGMVSTPGSSL